MLIIVSVTHFTSWLPLNLANVIITTLDSEENPLFEDIENLYILFAICHIASMTSAISNPVLYGFMNENFLNVFSKFWQSFKECLTPCNFRSDNKTSEEIPINHLIKPTDI